MPASRQRDEPQRSGRTFVLAIVALLMLSGVSAVETEEPMGVEQVVRSWISGVPAETLIDRIRSAQVDFDLSEEMLTELRAAGLPDAVIEAMVDRQTELHPPPAESPFEPEPETGPPGELRFRFSIAGKQDENGRFGGTLALLDAVAPQSLQQLGVEDPEARITDVAIYVACLSATHVPDYWRSHTPLGRDFNSAPRHEMLAFHAGAVVEKAGPTGEVSVLERPGGEARGKDLAMLRLELPETLDVPLDPLEAHDLSVGLAVEIDGRFYRITSERMDDVVPAELDGVISVVVTPAANLDPGSIRIELGVVRDADAR